MRCATRASNGPDHLGLCAFQVDGGVAEDDAAGAAAAAALWDQLSAAVHGGSDRAAAVAEAAVRDPTTWTIRQ